jgi:hypothetical protein
MAEVRCPMCGKANPAELDECQYCQARLRPIWGSTSLESPSDSYDDQTSDLPEWLKSLRGPDQGQNEPAVSNQEGHGGLPDWLGELRKQPADDAGLQSDQPSGDLGGRSEESDSTWLQDILAEDDLAEDATFSGQMNNAFRQEDASWISRIGLTPIEEEQPQESSETLDWLNELEQAAPDLDIPGAQDWTSRQTLQPLESAEPLPDWLAEAKPDTPEWLGQATALGASESSDAAGPDLFEKEALPDWLQQAAPSIQEPAEQGDVSASEWTKLASAESAIPEPVGDEALNWLSGGEDEELPAWLFVQSPTGEPAELAEPSPSQAVEETELVSDDLVDWLPPEIEDIPDWLKASPEAQGEEPLVPLFAEEPAPAGLFMDEPFIDGLEQAPAGEEPEIPLETSEDGEIPWLVAGAAAAVASAGLALGGEPAEENLGWLDELESTYGSLSPNVPEEAASAEGEAEGLGLEPGSALPIWLARASEEEALAQEASAEGEDELSRAELPSWLQAMKPVGVTAAAAALTGEPEPQQVEGAGPLAGLRGALPAEPDVSQAQKPPVYTVKLQVTETQQLQAELLRGMVEAEGQPQALPRRPVIRSQDVIRVFIAVLLIVPILFVMLTGVPQFGLPALSMEVNAVGEMIDSLAPGAPVLLAVDYQPGFTGEMDAVALPVVQHLFDQGAYLALVSTISTGPVQAEHLLSLAQSSSGAPLQTRMNSVNLGYIPGGATGLLGFAQSPSDVLPTNLAGERAWDAAGLQGVDSLEKFALVIVATENPDVARYWIEQVQPQLGATPLVMVLSAQAEPMVWPYYFANPSQVQGLVGGLAGGAAYLARSAQSGLATQYWSPYSAGALIAVLLMILGGIIYLISAQVARRKEKTGGEKRS